MVAFRYSEWDGTQEIPPLNPDEVLEALTDDLMNFGDLQHAMRNLLQRGMKNPAGDRLQGLRDLLQQLRQQRRNTLDKYNLSSVMDDIKQRLDEVLEMERGTIERRLDEAAGPQDAQNGPPQQGSPLDSGDGQGDASSSQAGGSPRASAAPSGQQGQASPSGATASGQQGGDEGEGDGSPASGDRRKR